MVESNKNIVERACTECKEVKPIELFSRTHKNGVYFRRQCIECMKLLKAERDKIYAVNNPQKKLAAVRKHKQSYNYKLYQFQYNFYSTSPKCLTPESKRILIVNKLIKMDEPLSDRKIIYDLSKTDPDAALKLMFNKIYNKQKRRTKHGNLENPRSLHPNTDRTTEERGGEKSVDSIRPIL